MNSSDVQIHLKQGRSENCINGVRVHFSAHQLFRFDGDDKERACLRLLCDDLLKRPGLAFYGSGPLLGALFKEEPKLQSHGVAIIVQKPQQSELYGLPVIPANMLPENIQTVFLSDTKKLPRDRARKYLPDTIQVIDADLLTELAPQAVPGRGWTPVGHHIYPMDIPEIAFEKNLDILLIDCPARNLALMPNGLAYVHNALKNYPIRLQTFDVDIITYHRFHIARLFDEGGSITLSNGLVMPEDPWQAEHYNLWSDEAVIDYFRPVLDETVEAIIEANPKILGLSVHASNETFSREVVRRAKEKLKDLVVVVGGFSCYNPNIGRLAFPECDYMCMGEADLTVGPLVVQLAKGERPKNQAGILSRFDNEDYFFIPGPMPHNLDTIEFPKYEWFDLSIYRNFNNYQLTPVIASRGCRWSRCTFCAERFYWRIRSAENFADELEWLFQQGCTLFMFNESDLNGMPERLLDICDEIIRRGLKIKLTGQLRIHKKSDRAFFDKLREAGMVALRFGVDAFSENTVRLQKKGYTTATINQNLKDCWEAGIYTEINWVIGVPGETEADVQEGIDLMISNKPYIGRLANINPLILSNGSVYWLEPEKHNIKFREPQEVLYERHPRALPADAWYSEEPYIDAQVRKDWFERIVMELHKSGFDTGAWAEKIIADVKSSKDQSRSAGTKVSAEALSDAQATQMESGTAMRAGSALGSEVLENLPDQILLVRFKGKWFAYDGDDLKQVLQGGKHNKKTPPSLLLPDAIRNPRTIVTRMASKLPQELLITVIRAYKIERSRRQDAPARTDAQNIGILLKGLLNLLTSRLKRTMSTNPSLHRAEKVIIGESNAIITRIVSQNAVPEFMCSVGHYNIVCFDGLYYGVPQKESVVWEDGHVERMPNVVYDSSVKGAIAMVRSKLGIADTIPTSNTKNLSLPANDVISETPILLEKVNDYSIISYEGWVYGIPKEHADVDLTETDPMELPGVIKDVSRDVVHLEIFEGTPAKAAG